MSTTAEQRIFISYRRSDCQSQANGLNDGLRHRMPESRVFMDIDSIPIGADFEEHIRGEIEQCHVALILIGDNWLDARPGSDVRRIDEANDFVRLEVESALASKHLRVIPVLVEGASMPTPDELPESIQRLARLNAFEMSDQRWSTRHRAPDPAAAAAERRGTATARPRGHRRCRSPTWTMPPSATRSRRCRTRFKTKDVSEHPAVLATHTEVSQLRNYHTIIGRYLMQHRGASASTSPASPSISAAPCGPRPAGRTYAPYPRTSVPASAPGLVRACVPSAQPSGFVPPRDGSPPAACPCAREEGPLNQSAMILWCVLTCRARIFRCPSLGGQSSPVRQDVPQAHAQARQRLWASWRARRSCWSAPAPRTPRERPPAPLLTPAARMLFLTMAARGRHRLTSTRSRRLPSPAPSPFSCAARARERYRQLVEKDRPLARSMHVGRPDVPRDYDDGGLLDLNSVPARALAEHGGLEPCRGRQGRRGARPAGPLRQHGRAARLRRISPRRTATRLRDVAVFV